jgi:predicted flap endonuclease-1-like 5' DNA nuclease
MSEATMVKIIEIEGIGEAFAERLRECGIDTIDDLLLKATSQDGVEQIAGQAGIRRELILQWVTQADLFRIKGVGGQYAGLLENAGVDSVAELAQRNAENLVQTMAEVNVRHRLVRRLPAESLVGDWILQAQSLPPVVLRGWGGSPVDVHAEPSPDLYLDLEESLPGEGGTDNLV